MSATHAGKNLAYSSPFSNQTPKTKAVRISKHVTAIHQIKKQEWDSNEQCELLPQHKATSPFSGQ